MDHTNNVRAEVSGRKGRTVITAKGGAEAIERVREKPFDMIFKDDRELKFLLDKLKRNRNIDFGQYRRSILERGIQHRLHLTGCADYMEYVMLLNKDPQEYDRLIEALTIRGSEFTFTMPKKKVASS